jgi:hypothetical protein
MSTHLFDDEGKHIYTISTAHLQWLWTQYNTFINKKEYKDPPLQSFETKVTTLYQQYLINTNPKEINPQSQYHINEGILQFLIDNFSITHLYLFSSITCHIKITSYNSPNPRDQIFGSQGQAFQKQWQGISLVHPPTNKLAQQAIRWTRLVAKENEQNVTIFILPYQ